MTTWEAVASENVITILISNRWVDSKTFNNCKIGGNGFKVCIAICFLTFVFKYRNRLYGSLLKLLYVYNYFHFKETAANFASNV